MSDFTWTEPPPRKELLAGLRAEFGRLPGSLRVVAENLLGADARIDWLAADADGRVHVVLVSTDSDDLALVTLGLAQRAWVEARLPDWAQLAPQQGLRSEDGVRLVLLAPDFSATAEAAVRAVGEEDVDLVRYRCVRSGPPGGPTGVVIEPSGRREERVRPGPAAAPAADSRFRTGLSDADLLVSTAERRALELEVEIPEGGARTKKVTAGDKL